MLLAAVEVVVVLTAAYFEPTYRVRGRLHGEAFYASYPTSFWRARMDRWMEQFFSPEEAARMVPSDDCEVLHGDAWLILRPAPQTWWDRVRDRFRSDAERDRDWDTPEVLLADDGEAVLRELRDDARYPVVVDRALRNLEKKRAMP